MSSANGASRRGDGIVITGGGLAAQRCIETLRRNSYAGAIRLVCEEAQRPYDRPPLSKQILHGAPPERLPFKPAGWYDQQEIDLFLGVSATQLRPGERAVRLSTGAELKYDHLLIATGSRPRTLPTFAGYDNVSLLRTVDDSLRLRAVLERSPRLTVIGGGFIGQEVASSARQMGCQVTMIEAAATPLEQVLGRPLGSWFTRLHESEGVDVITNSTVRSVEGTNVITRLRLSTGRAIETDHLVVGVGVTPNTEWLRDSGLAHDGGVPVDVHGRTGAGGVMAAGDAAATFDALAGRHVSGSHWEAAGRQGARSARVMIGLEPGPTPLTSFWTDQYGIRIQYLGHARLSDSISIDGDATARSFIATFTRAGRPVAALLVDRPRELPAIRDAIQKGMTGK